jgi:hypothetical protein
MASTILSNEDKREMPEKEAAPSPPTDDVANASDPESTKSQPDAVTAAEEEGGFGAYTVSLVSCFLRDTD